jgi:hypothetical protein
MMSEKKKQHPLVEKILSLVEFDPMYANMGMPDTKVLYLSDESREIVRNEFQKYFNEKEVLNAIVNLIQLANVFDEQEHTEIAVTILEIVVTANEHLQLIKDKKMKTEKGKFK